MYHLGPGPLGSILSNLYAFRRKPPLRRKVGYAALRGAVHATKGAEHLRTFAALRSWLAVPETSKPGRDLAQILAIVKNYGFAYRMGTVRAISDAVRTVLGADPASIRLVVDASHNMLQPEVIAGERRWVSRANCCRPAAGKPGIVAGDHQVPSCLVLGPPGCEDRLAGFDHGIGHLLERARAADELAVDGRGHHVSRLRMVRGTGEVDRQQQVPLLQTSLLERTMEHLSASGFAEPVAYLRPIANLKHRARS
jgi:hypothetical protein